MVSNGIEWRTEQRKLSDLVEFEKNPRILSQHDAEHIRRSIEKFGLADPLVVNKDGQIIGGHQRKRILAALETYGPDAVIDVRIPSRSLTAREVEELNIRLNKNSGEFDWDILASEFDVDDLLNWGFTELDLELGGVEVEEEEPPEDPGPQIDRAGELQEKWGTALGQVWELGNHRLFVGPAEQAHIECDLAVYDPPFNWSPWQYENSLSWTIWKSALVMGLRNVMSLAERDDWLHWWIYDSGVGRFGGKGYHPLKSCILCMYLGLKKRFFVKPALDSLDRYSIEHADWILPVVRMTHSIRKSLKDDEGVFALSKPLSLWDYIISLYSEKGEIVGDPFAGGGGVLIAAHQLSRVYRGAEINACYAACILERFAKTFQIGPRLVE